MDKHIKSASPNSGSFQKLRDDMPWQFRGKRNIDALLRAFAEQFDGLYEVFRQLETLRRLDTSEGAQLDGIGNIVGLPRAQAAKLEQMRTKQSAGVIGDETYRMWLRYKMFVNAFDGTYRDFMRNLNMFSGGVRLYYSEDAAHPAVIFLDVEEMPGAVIPEDILSIPIVKPAGVGLKLTFMARDEYTAGEYSAGVTAELIEEAYTE